MYASRLRNPAETYRQIDIACRTDGASPHALVMLLYEDLLGTLRLGALAIERGDGVARSERVQKALAILFALEAGLDFRTGGSVAEALSRFYRGARESVMRSSLAGDAEGLRAAAANIAEIADSWRSIAA